MLKMINYLATHKNIKVHLHASDMVLNIHLDAPYMTEPKSRSRLAGYFSLGSVPIKRKEIKMNGNIFAACGIRKIVVAAAVEAEV